MFKALKLDGEQSNGGDQLDVNWDKANAGSPFEPPAAGDAADATGTGAGQQLLNLLGPVANFANPAGWSSPRAAWENVGAGAATTALAVPAAVSVASAALTAAATGFTIIPTWDASVLNSANAAAFEAATMKAIGKFEALITTHETLKIDFGYGIMPYDGSNAGVGGGSSIGNTAAFTWTQVYNAVQAIENNPLATAVQKAAAALMTKDNAKYAGVLNTAMISVTRAEAVALGLSTAAYTGVYDGWIALGSGPFDWAQNNAAQEDAVSALEHEISEVLGRTDNLGVANGDAGHYTLLDLFHYGSATASTVGGAAPGTAAGALDQPFVAGYNPNAVSYFSYNGSSITWQYDTPTEYGPGNGEDVADWSTTTTSRIPLTDSFDGAGGNAIDPALSVPDLQVLNVLGYTERTTLPLDDFNGNGRSDLIAQYTNGVVDVGEIGAAGKFGFVKVDTVGTGQTFEGNGNFLGDATGDYLLQNNTTGALLVGAVSGITRTYTAVGALGLQWSFVGTGDFLGEGHDQFLIQNGSGAIDVGDVVNGRAKYTTVGALGAQWTFQETGNFLGHGKSDFLIQSTGGAMSIGEVSAGKATYLAIGTLGSQWTFVGAGDFRGEGHDQFLVQDTAGHIDVGDVVSGKAQLTQVGQLGSAWSFVGTGNYTGSGAAGFMIQNTTNGALDLGMIVSGHVALASAGALGLAWTFQ